MTSKLRKRPSTQNRKFYSAVIVIITIITICFLSQTSSSLKAKGNDYKDEQLASLVLKQDTQDTKSAIDKLTEGMMRTEQKISKISTSVEDMQSQVLTLSSHMVELQQIWQQKQQHGSLKVIEETPVEEQISRLIKTPKGEGWEIVNFDNEDSDSTNPHNFSCDMQSFKSTGYKICVHPFDDIISNVIRRNGSWQDCAVLSKTWNRIVKDTTKDPVYVEIGANIGSCIMEMLFTTNAPIIAFEPNPKNLYPMKETLRALPKSYQDRVAIFPIALGSTATKSTVYSASNNMGNSHVGKPVKDHDVGFQEFRDEDTFDIYVERLDNILNTGFNIPLMKLDAQGFECEILSGMSHEFAASLQHVHFEKADRFLKEHGCDNLLSKFRDLGFTIYQDNTVVGPEKDNQPLPYDLDARHAE